MLFSYQFDKEGLLKAKVYDTVPSKQKGYMAVYLSFTQVHDLPWEQ